MKCLTLVTLFALSALSANVAWADAQHTVLPVDHYQGAAACDAEVANAPAMQHPQAVAAGQTKIAQISHLVEVNCATTPYVGVCSEQD